MFTIRSVSSGLVASTFKIKFVLYPISTFQKIGEDIFTSFLEDYSVSVAGSVGSDVGLDGVSVGIGTIVGVGRGVSVGSGVGVIAGVEVTSGVGVTSGVDVTSGVGVITGGVGVGFTVGAGEQ